MAVTSHVKTVRERIVQLLKDDSDFDKIPILEGPIDLVQLKYPCIIVSVTGQRFFPTALGGKYDRELTVRIDCYEKELDPEVSMEKVEWMAENIVDNIISNYTLQKDNSPVVRLATNYSVTYDLVEAGNLILRDASLIFSTEKEKE